MSPAPQAALLPGRAVFASEITQAQVLGFKLKIASRAGSVSVRLVPTNKRSRIICSRQGANMIEASCAVGSDDERLDATRETIRAALNLAKDSGA